MLTVVSCMLFLSEKMYRCWYTKRCRINNAKQMIRLYVDYMYIMRGILCIYNVVYST